MFRILVCEESLSLSVSPFFSKYEVDFIYSEEELLEYTYSKSYDMYIIHINYIDTLKEIFQENTHPIIFFIDDFYSLAHVKKAFSFGDEYLIKPLYIEDFEVRVSYQYKKLFNITSSILRYKDFFYHTSSKQLFYLENKVKLSPTKRKLVELFLTRKNKYLTKFFLYEMIGSSNNASLRVYMSELNRLGLTIQYDNANESYILIA
ncbi:response regulator transcription factor [Sulfurimonas sp. SAG-AH-194-I05]|nr:hypothetical protein [Sulfurimonas sp. SAG-AH-194-I05]MDF1876184.1 response regulator transcription factor [Sulfurimonas sp. SAG-AH-194-I05]